METIMDLQHKYHNMAIFQSKDIQSHHLLLLLKQIGFSEEQSASEEHTPSSRVGAAA